MKNFINYENSILKRFLYITVSGAIVVSFFAFLISFIIFNSSDVHNNLENISNFIKTHPFASSLFIGILFLIGSFIPIIMTYFLIGKTIVNPIKEVINAMEKITMGELDNELKVNRKDEIGMLQEEFERMRISLKTIIDKLEKEEL
jgi:methyl-accepting chemotaxis protein